MSPLLVCEHPARRAGRVCVVAMLAVAVFGAGCARHDPPSVVPVHPAASPEAAEPTEITFAYWALAPREIRTVHELVADFEAREPSVRVRLIEVSDRYYEKLTTMFAAGSPPDAFSLNYGRLSDFARQGLLADLRPLVAGRQELSRGQFVEAAYDSFEAVGATVGTEGLFALPRDWGPTNLLVYNKDAFDAAGLDYADGEWTWTRFADACRKLTIRHGDAGTQQYGASVCLYPYAMAAWVFQNEGDFLSPDGRRSALGDAEVLEAVEFLRGLTDEGIVAPASAAEDESMDLFLRGKAAMAFATPYSLGDVRRKEGLRWGIAAPLKGVRRATGCIPTGIALAAASEHREAAFRFAAYWVTTAARQVAASGYCVPAWKPALESDALAEGFGADAAEVMRAAALYARPHPVSATAPYEVMLSQLKTALELIFAADENPAVALQAAQRRIDAEAAKQ